MKIGDLIEWDWCVGPGDQWKTFYGMIVASRGFHPSGRWPRRYYLDVLESTGKVIEMRAEDARVIG